MTRYHALVCDRPYTLMQLLLPESLLAGIRCVLLARDHPLSAMRKTCYLDQSSAHMIHSHHSTQMGHRQTASVWSAHHWQSLLQAQLSHAETQPAQFQPVQQEQRDVNHHPESHTHLNERKPLDARRSSCMVLFNCQDSVSLQLAYLNQALHSKTSFVQT